MLKKKVISILCTTYINIAEREKDRVKKKLFRHNDRRMNHLIELQWSICKLIPSLNFRNQCILLKAQKKKKKKFKIINEDFFFHFPPFPPFCCYQIDTIN